MISRFVQLIGVPNVVCPKGHIRSFRNLVVLNNWVRCIVIHPFIEIRVTKKEAFDGFLRFCILVMLIEVGISEAHRIQA